MHGVGAAVLRWAAATPVANRDAWVFAVDGDVLESYACEARWANAGVHRDLDDVAIGNRSGAKQGTLFVGIEVGPRVVRLAATIAKADSCDGVDGHETFADRGFADHAE